MCRVARLSISMHFIPIRAIHGRQISFGSMRISHSNNIYFFVGQAAILWSSFSSLGVKELDWLAECPSIRFGILLFESIYWKSVFGPMYWKVIILTIYTGPSSKGIFAGLVGVLLFPG
jgi:hypothetical protein